MNNINGASQVAELAITLKDQKRTRPVLVVSTPNNSNRPAFDLDSLDEEVGAFCDTYLIHTGDDTRQLQDLLPEEQDAYGGAARCYPVSFAKTGSASKLRYVYPADAKIESTARLATDIWAAVAEAGLLAKPSPSAKAVTGEVRQVIRNESALIQLANGDWVTLRQELAFPGVPLSWLFSVGQSVSGLYDSDNRLFTIAEQTFSAADAVSRFGWNTVTLGWVKETSRKSAKIALHPNLVFEVSKEEITGNPYDVVSEYLGVGDVVPVRLYRDPQGRTRLKMNDIDDDDIVHPALILTAGGEPWLAEDRRFELEDENDDFAPVVPLDTFELEVEFEGEDEASVVDVSKPSLPTTGKTHQERLNESSIVYQRGEILRLKKAVVTRDEQLDEWAKQMTAQKETIDSLRARNREFSELAAEGRKAKLSQARGNSNPYDRISRFTTNQEWFAEELRRAWLSIYTPQERAQFDLDKAKWSVGEAFLKGVNQRDLDPSEVRKLVRAVLHLVTGRNARDQNNEAHALLENGRPHVRGGDAGFRMHIENGQPQAKRLHFYKLQAGGFELSKVGIHDDYLP